MSVVVLTERGAALGQQITQALPDAQMYARTGRVTHADAFFDDTAACLREMYLAGRSIVGVCASGILIRALTPVIENKTVEPAVIAVSEDGVAAYLVTAHIR